MFRGLRAWSRMISLYSITPFQSRSGRERPSTRLSLLLILPKPALSGVDGAEDRLQLADVRRVVGGQGEGDRPLLVDDEDRPTRPPAALVDDAVSAGDTQVRVAAQGERQPTQALAERGVRLKAIAAQGEHACS